MIYSINRPNKYTRNNKVFAKKLTNNKDLKCKNKFNKS